jgi:hypothetical protein
MSEGWDWEFRPPAAQTFEELEIPVQTRIVTKLDEIVDDEWREPYEYIEPLSECHTGRSGSEIFALELTPTGSGKQSLSTISNTDPGHTNQMTTIDTRALVDT